MSASNSADTHTHSLEKIWDLLLIRRVGSLWDGEHPTVNTILAGTIPSPHLGKGGGGGGVVVVTARID